jgi:hypothetical protein
MMFMPESAQGSMTILLFPCSLVPCFQAIGILIPFSRAVFCASS